MGVRPAALAANSSRDQQYPIIKPQDFVITCCFSRRCLGNPTVARLQLVAQNRSLQGMPLFDARESPCKVSQGWNFLGSFATIKSYCAFCGHLRGGF